MLGAQSIQLGVSNVVVCGGQESMSRVPHAILMRPGIKMGHGTLNDTMIHDGLTDAFNHYHMGITGTSHIISILRGLLVVLLKRVLYCIFS